MRPAERRPVVHYLRAEWCLAERRACGLASLGRSTVRYLGRRSGDQELRERLRELAAERRRFGYRRLHVLLRREGHEVNHKRVYRLYRDEGLTVRKRRRKRGVSRAERVPLQAPSDPDQLWSLDFVQDALWWGRKIRLLTVEDAHTRQALAIQVDTSLSGAKVARVLERLSIRVVTSNADGADYSSREGTPGFAPQLVITLQ